MGLVAEVDACLKQLAHRKIRQCHALLLLFRLNLRKANSILFENATGRNSPDFSRTIPCLTCGMPVPIHSIWRKSKAYAEKTWLTHRARRMDLQ
jgi:hypothetical protein